MKNKILFIIALSVLSGCAPSYRQVLKECPSYNSHDFTAAKGTLYNAAISALCKRNFMIESEDLEKGFILAKRSFQSGRTTTALLVQGKIVSVNESKSTLYLNALETKEVSYVADRTRFFMFLIPLPGGGGKEASTVKEGEKSIQDKVFYQGMFKAIEKEIPLVAQEKPVEAVKPVPVPEDKNTTASSNP
jgi:hypothetical protein